jgi:hypothetical protein|tara:strand:- start:692 stop:871 length:180 start_codon:yes stop_codon:yes gene_type:complete
MVAEVRPIDDLMKKHKVEAALLLAPGMITVAGTKKNIRAFIKEYKNSDTIYYIRSRYGQ